MKNTLRAFISPLHILFIIFMILYVPSCAVKPASELDNPEYHHKAGMRHVEMGKYTESLTSFCLLYTSDAADE